LPREEESEYAVSNERDEMVARVRICWVDFVWIVVRVREAREAEGSRARDGRVMLVRVYDVP